MTLKERIIRAKNWFATRSIAVKTIMIVVTMLAIWFLVSSVVNKKSTKTTYQTDVARRDTLIVSVSASGNVSSANSAVVTTQTSGVVSKIFVQNGDKVKSGDPIAEVELDMEGKQRSTQAYASYLSAKNSLDSANTAFYTLQSQMFSEWKSFTDLSENSTYTNSDGSPNTENRTLAQFISANDDWLATEAKYKNQKNVVAQAQASVNSAWASYQQASPTIYAPISGTISGLSLQIGSVLTAQTSSTGNSTSQRIANIKTQATPVASISLNEIDVPKVTIGNKATLTLSAFPDQTFTGKVVSIDTTGSVSSNVTTYPAYIVFDSAIDGIYPNMAVDAIIITLVKDDVILVPNAAVQTANGESTVRVMKQGNVNTVTVNVGQSNDADTEISSGISEGDTVVTGTSTTGSTATSTTSLFSAFGGNSRSFGGGGTTVRTTGGR